MITPINPNSRNAVSEKVAENLAAAENLLSEACGESVAIAHKRVAMAHGYVSVANAYRELLG